MEGLLFNETDIKPTGKRQESDGVLTGEKSASLLLGWGCAPCSWVHEPMGGSPMPRVIAGYSLVKERA
jgi:hypothetical protein